MQCIRTFSENYHRDPAGISFCPYRICPLGAHTDHNLGKVTGLAIDKGIHIAYGPKRNGVIEMTSLNFPKRAQWHVHSVPDKEDDWADYLRGATLMLSRKYPLQLGMCGVIEGTLPIGGLSSSAAVIIASSMTSSFKPRRFLSSFTNRTTSSAFERSKDSPGAF